MNNIIIDQQHGFTKEKSTITDLTIFKNSEALDRGEQVDVVYTDFFKALDRVNHAILLDKLKYYGLNGTIFCWIKTYLAERTQTVLLNGIQSGRINVTSGVRQGSHLGPLLFGIFVNDLAKNLKYCNSLIFADDTKLYMKIKSSKDATYVQKDLDAIEGPESRIILQ